MARIVVHMSKLKAIVDTYVHDHGSSQSWVAERMGISRSALNGWWTRGRTSPPAATLLRSLAVAVRVPYETVLDATLHDYGYLPLEEGSSHVATRAEKSDGEDSDDQDGESFTPPGLAAESEPQRSRDRSG